MNKTTNNYEKNQCFFYKICNNVTLIQYNKYK